VWYARGDGIYFVGASVRLFKGRAEIDAKLAAGVRSDESFFDGLTQDRGEQDEDIFGASIRQVFA
jgi:hypothetical protein